MKAILLVFIGGGAGSLVRYAIAVAAGWWRPVFPWATLAANALSCFVLGVFLALAMRDTLSTEYRLLFMTGFCGGFSTFSTFTSESWQLMQQGRWELALFNVALNLSICLICLYLGIRIAQP